MFTRKLAFFSVIAPNQTLTLTLTITLKKYEVFSFIAPKTNFAVFTVKLGILQRYCTGKWISFPVFYE